MPLSRHAPSGRIVSSVKNTADEFGEFGERYMQWVLLVSIALGQEIVEFLFGADGLDLFGGAYTAERAQGGMVGTIIPVVVVAVVGVVGILIYSKVEDSISVTGDLSTSVTELTSNFGEATELIGIVLLVLVASLVIAVINRFR